MIWLEIVAREDDWHNPIAREPFHEHGAAFSDVLIRNGIAISMHGKGAWRGNVFVERLWRGVKYEEVYLRACDTASEARASIGRSPG